MRTFGVTLCILAVAVGAVVVYLVASTPDDAPPLRFPLTASHRQLLSHVPAGAEAYALVPAPVVLLRKLAANPVTATTILTWTSTQPMPPTMMMGRADAAIWKTGKQTSYAVRFDPVRAVIVRVWTMLSSADARWAGRTLIVDGGAPAPPALPPEIARTDALPGGDALVVQRTESRGAFPPIGRPAVTSVRVTVREIELTSFAPSVSAAVASPPTVRASLPASAMLAVAFTDPPRVLGDLDRLLAADVDALVGAGATMAVYRVDTGTFLPRPFLAIAVPANDASRATLARYDGLMDMGGERIESGGELVVAFDRSSAGLYLKDGRAPMPWAANRWSLRMDPVRLVPVLRKVAENPAVRFAAPRVHRGARDLRRWMGALEQAASVEAAASTGDGVEELRVRIVSK